MARPGAGVPERPVRKAGSFSSTREGWVKIENIEVILHVGTDDDFPEKYVLPEDCGEPHRLAIRVPGIRRMVWLNLSAMTEQELDMLQGFFNMAFDRARPVSKALDEDATRRFEAGDDPLKRLYRTVPQVFVRERESGQYRPGLPGRPDGPDAAPGDAGDGRPEPGVPGSGVPVSEPADVGTEHDEP